MAIGDRRFMGLVVAIVFLCIGVAVLGWANYSLGSSSDRRYAAIARRVDDLSRANGIKDEQLQAAGIPPSPLLATTTTTTAPETRTTATTARTSTTAAARSTTTEHEAPTTSTPTTAAPTTTTTRPGTTTTTRPCIVPVTIRPGRCP